MNEERRNYNPYLIGGIIAAVVILYAVCPVDVISDFFVGIGQIDDAAIIILGFLAEIANAVCGAICSCNQGKADETEKENAYYANAEYGEYREVNR